MRQRQERFHSGTVEIVADLHQMSVSDWDMLLLSCRCVVHPIWNGRRCSAVLLSTDGSAHLCVVDCCMPCAVGGAVYGWIKMQAASGRLSKS